MSENCVGLVGPRGSEDADAAYIIIEDWLNNKGIGTVAVIGRHHFKSDISLIGGLAVVTHDYKYEQDLFMDGDPIIPEVARIATEASLPIFINTPVSAVTLGVADLKPELIVYGKDFDVIKNRLGEN